MSTSIFRITNTLFYIESIDSMNLQSISLHITQNKDRALKFYTQADPTPLNKFADILFAAFGDTAIKVVEIEQ